MTSTYQVCECVDRDEYTSLAFYQTITGILFTSGLVAIRNGGSLITSFVGGIYDYIF